MGLQATSLAAAVGAAVDNVQFASGAQNVPRKVLVIGTYDAAKTGITDDTPQLLTSPEDAGARYGFGSMLHRLVLGAYAGSNGVETWAIPQAEAGGAVAAAGEVLFGGPSTAAGTVYLYIGGDVVSASFPAASTPAAVCSALVAAVNALPNLPVIAAINATPEQMDLTSKSKGPFGNDITIEFNLGFNEELPAGITALVTDMTGGAGVPAIADALDGTGTGDDQNAEFFTDVTHGYGTDSTTLDALSTYNGEGNQFLGNYDKLVSRPFRCLIGSVLDQAGGLATLVALGDARPLDRTNGIICVPGSATHPAEIGAIAIGVMARVNSDRAAQSYIGQVLAGVRPGAVGVDRWTSDYDNRDLAVKSGISPTVVRNSAVEMQNVLTFYHPDNVPVDSNGYRSMRNISILQNVLFNVRLNFSQAKWQGISIVADTARVTVALDREKARDIGAVLDDLVALAVGFESHAWIFTAAFTIDRLATGDLVTIRPGGIGFDSILPIILSGEGGILDTVVQFDTSLAVLL